jgi:hypothetical protein
MTYSITTLCRWSVLPATAILAACTSLQGGVGPLANPKASQIVDLVYELNAQAGPLSAAPPMINASAEVFETKCLVNERTLELASGSSYDREGTIWKSSDIPNAAQRETQCLSQAQQRFNDSLKDKDEGQKKAKRNSVQNRLLTASEQSCSLFKRYLNNTQSNSNFVFGAITTITAGAAASVTNAAAAKNYAGTTAVVSGLGAEFNADMFGSQLAFVISKAIDNEREKALTSIRTKQDTAYSKYPVEEAIGDALKYHDKCSLYQGLQQMSDSIMIAKDPGLKHLTELLGTNGELAYKEGKITAYKFEPEVPSSAVVSAKLSAASAAVSAASAERSAVAAASSAQAAASAASAASSSR